MNKQKRNLMISMLIFGTIGLVRRGIPYSSGIVALGRGIIGVLFLAGLSLVQKRCPDWKAIRRNGMVLAVSGGCIGFNWILLFEAYRYTTISAATVSYYMAPIFMILASPLLLREKLTPFKACCAAAALCGMVLVSGVLETGITGMKGVIYGLGAAVLYAGVILLNKTINGIDAMDRTAVQLFAGVAVLTPYLLVTENWHALQFDGWGLLLLLLAGVLHTGFAYALYFGSMDGVPAQTVAIFSYIDPVTALLLSAVVLRETMSVPAAVGAVLVISAAFLSEQGETLRKQRQRTA